MSVVHLPPGGSARLVLGADFDSGGGDVLLLELDEALLEEALRCGLVLKGAPDEGAVLCGGGRTFSLRAVGTSNTLLLVPPPADGGAEFAPPAAPYETPGGGAGGAGGSRLRCPTRRA